MEKWGRIRLAFEGTGGLNLPLSISATGVEVRLRSWRVTVATGISSGQAEVLSLAQKSKNIGSYCLLWLAADFMSCLDILMVFTLVCQPTFQKSDQNAKVPVCGWSRAWPSIEWWEEKREVKGTGWTGAATQSPGWCLAPGRYVIHTNASHWMVIQAGEACIGPFRQQSAWDTFKLGL